jgi:hypothetical protein
VIEALSIMQPWASLIVGGPLTRGVKPIENRTWRAPARLVGKRIAIHASKKLDLESFEDLLDGSWWPYAKPKEFPTSAVIGTATLVRVFEGEPGLMEPRDYPAGMPDDCKRWYFGPVGFELREAMWFEPVRCGGRLGFWPLPADVERRVVEQLGERAA